MIRSFIALELPAELKTELIEVINRYRSRTGEGINWVKPENLHLTLLFIGDVQPELMPDINKAIQELLIGFPAFRFRAMGLELFPAREPRMLWLKLETENDDVFKLQRRILHSIHSLGIEPDRKPLRLHVTLARLKTALNNELARELMQTEINKHSQTYESICLFRSVLSPSGPSYSVIEQYNLK
jgi:2'-5' RNA ligase